MILMLATAFIDLDMTSDEKTKSGVYKLTQKERSYLQLWIDNHYDQRLIPLEQTEIQKNPTVFRIEKKEERVFIHLTDETCWEVRPKDEGVALGWINPDAEILIRPSGEEEYPFTLTNSISKSTIRGKSYGSTIH